jgi:hypothetical protein
VTRDKKCEQEMKRDRKIDGRTENGAVEWISKERYNKNARDEKQWPRNIVKKTR